MADPTTTEDVDVPEKKGAGFFGWLAGLVGGAAALKGTANLGVKHQLKEDGGLILAIANLEIQTPRPADFLQQVRGLESKN